MKSAVETWNGQWYEPIASFVRIQMASADPAHALEHVQRVVENATRLMAGTSAEPGVVLPSAWLHDCVVVPKDSPMRSQSSRMAAQRAVEFLTQAGYPNEHHGAIEHCIAAHSFSAGIPCETLEAKIVQDADRLEALGAIGLSRCLMTGGAMGQRLYDPDEPFPISRGAREDQQSVDHFFVKLLGLHRTMQTESGRVEASHRTRFLIEFLEQLASEIGIDSASVRSAIEQSQRDSST